MEASNLPCIQQRISPSGWLASMLDRMAADESGRFVLHPCCEICTEPNASSYRCPAMALQVARAAAQGSRRSSPLMFGSLELLWNATTTDYSVQLFRYGPYLLIHRSTKYLYTPSFSCACRAAGAPRISQIAPLSGRSCNSPLALAMSYLNSRQGRSYRMLETACIGLSRPLSPGEFNLSTATAGKRLNQGSSFALRRTDSRGESDGQFALHFKV